MKFYFWNFPFDIFRLVDCGVIETADKRGLLYLSSWLHTRLVSSLRNTLWGAPSLLLPCWVAWGK